MHERAAASYAAPVRGGTGDAADVSAGADAGLGADDDAAGQAPGTAARRLSPAELLDAVREIIHTRTGYPHDMLDAGLDLEADLSVDSIKRVEIIGALADRIGLPQDADGAMEPAVEQLSRVKTISGIVDWIAAAHRETAPEAAPPPEPAAALAGAGPAVALAGVGSAPAPALSEPAASLSELSQPSQPSQLSQLSRLSESTPPALAHASTLPKPSAGAGAGAEAVAASAPVPQRPTRYLVRVAHLGPPASRPPAEVVAGSDFTVVEDGQGVALALTALLESHGARVRTVPAERLAEVTADGVGGLVDLSALRAGRGAVLPGQYAGLRTALTGGARWLLLATAAGGTFGQDAAEDAPDPLPGAGLRGFARTAALEYPGVLIRAVDINPKDRPERIAAHLLAELCAPGEPVVVGRTNGTRTTLRTVATPLPHDLPATGRPTLDAGSVVLLTGGARGITARTAHALARAHGCHLELLGRTPWTRPPRTRRSRMPTTASRCAPPSSPKGCADRPGSRRRPPASWPAARSPAPSPPSNRTPLPSATTRPMSPTPPPYAPWWTTSGTGTAASTGSCTARAPWRTSCCGTRTRPPSPGSSPPRSTAPVTSWRPPVTTPASWSSSAASPGSSATAARPITPPPTTPWTPSPGPGRRVRPGAFSPSTGDPGRPTAVAWSPRSWSAPTPAGASPSWTPAPRPTPCWPNWPTAPRPRSSCRRRPAGRRRAMSDTGARRTGPRPTDAAIVGMGALFPGAGDLAAYRRNLLAGRDCITEVPPGRWDPEVYYDPHGAEGPARSDRFYCRRGGFLDELATFDPTRFGIMPATVPGAEPDQLLALRVIADAIADAGGQERLPADRSRIGVILGRGGFMGVATARLDQRVRTAHQLAATLRQLAPELGESKISAVRDAFQESLGPERPEASIGLVPSFTAARTANRLDFRGPAYTLDAACASSLLAVAQAVDLLAAGRCDSVVAGAVHHCHIATLWSVFTQLRALSPTQCIRPFDRRADGTLLSEGTGVVLLKRLADAERDGDRVYAVIRGAGVAGDGRASSLMNPRTEGQTRALQQAWGSAGLDPEHPAALGLLEAHGTGTPVGDAAELETLARVFGPPGAGRAPIGLGSVKSMLGHTMQAAGIAGLIKAALAVHDRTLPPTLHLDEPHEGLARTRMRPVTEAEPWDAGGAPLRAGVNAFGFGGINAHVILEEAPGCRPAAGPSVPPTSPLRTAEPERTVLLAAHSPAELAEKLRNVGEGAGERTGARASAFPRATALAVSLSSVPPRSAAPWPPRSSPGDCPGGGAVRCGSPRARSSGRTPGRRERGSPSSFRDWKRNRRRAWTTSPTGCPCRAPWSAGAAAWSSGPSTPSPSAGCSPAPWTDWASPPIC